MDRDLAALQEVRDSLRRARDARLALENASQEDCDRWAKAIADAGRREAVRLARLAVEETGMGHVTGKTLKNIFATEFTWGKIKDLKTAGIIHRDEAEGVVQVAHPAGVVAAVIPTTNPTSTALFKCIIALKARCSIVVSPHPTARKCIAESCRIVAEALQAAGAPDGAVNWLAAPTLESTQHLMSHRWTSIILATGGPGLVEAAYSSGKPAIGVGAGNSPAYIHHSADVEGLIPWLKALAGDEAIQTITPGVIARVRGRSPGLKLRLSTPMRGGFKLVARRGSTVQEVFVVTSLDAEELVRRIEASQPCLNGKERTALR